jgi:hypothetical protein
MPAWVLAEWWRAEHFRCPQTPWGSVLHDCDLPDEPRLVNVSATYPRWANTTIWGCRWVEVHPYYYGRRAVWAPRGVPKRFVDHVWNGPERVRERDDLKALRDEYNTYGDLEDGDFPCWQTRSFARWMWD